MRILGINCYGHDSSASLLEDERFVACASEERFTRKKLTGVFPSRAIDYCLNFLKSCNKQIDYAGYFFNPYQCLARKLMHIVRYLPGSISLFENESVLMMKMLRVQQKLLGSLPENNGGLNFKFFFVEHHLAHAASAFYPSGFEKAAIFSIDGVGEWCTVLYALGQDGKILPLKKIFFPNSIGLLYAAVTEYLGFAPSSDEYKVMGLASYGKPAYSDEFKKILGALNNGGIKVNTGYIQFHLGLLRSSLIGKKFLNFFGKPYSSEDGFSQRRADIAASMQLVLEDTVLGMLKYLHGVAKSDNLCLAGGVALNCAMNGRILREGPFKNIFVQPAANDSGTSLGAALYIHHVILGNKERYRLEDVYLGPQYSNEEIERQLKENKLRYTYHNDIEIVTAGLLAKGNIIGWFQGKMEFGPRALGARSILADPRKAKMKDIVNERIKHREAFRPFAPSVLEEKAGEYFEGCNKSPFMTIVYPVREGKKPLIPAVTHVDGTSRVQTVNKETSPKYWKLIKEFEKITGVPVVLNTSFNVKGEPIVCTPEDAIRCFYSTGLDYLAIGDYLVEK